MRIVLNGNPNIAGFIPQHRNGRCSPGTYGSQRGFDPEKLFDALLRDFAPTGRRTANPARDQRVGLRVVSWEQPDGWLFRAEVPGVPREQIEVSIDGNILTLKATRTLDVPEGFRLIRGERRGTEALTRFELPQDANAEQIEATIRDGILEVRVGRRQQSGRRIVPVLAADSAADTLTSPAEAPETTATESNDTTSTN